MGCVEGGCACSRKPIQIVDAANRLYYDELGLFQQFTYCGIHTVKYPTDLMVYAELIFKTKPQYIIETGTHAGGSALFLAHQLDVLAERFGELASAPRKVISIDTHKNDARPNHPRIVYLRGDSVSSSIEQAVDDLVHESACMVILDSDHSRTHVLQELRIYYPYVKKGHYLIVEDTNINGHPVFAAHGPGPWEALQAWLPLYPEFVVDSSCERFLLTANPGGYLRRL